MPKSLGVVIPAYRPNVGLLSTYVHSLEEGLQPAEIVVELDAPQDGVVEKLRSLPVTVNVSSNRRGKGAAITHGFEWLNTDVRMFLDADGSTPVESVSNIIRPIQDGSADLSVGSRRHPDAEITSHQTIARRYMGDAFAWMARRMLPTQLFDYQCGAKAVTDEAWCDVRSDLYENGFAWDLELVAIADVYGYDIAEVPVTWEDRPGSTVDPVDAVIEFSRALVSVRHRALALEGDLLHRTLPQGSSRPLIEAMGGSE